MPELPEVEVLARHLASRLPGRSIRRVHVFDRRTLRQSGVARFAQLLTRARFESVERRGKYLIFRIRRSSCSHSLLTHLGMTGRLYLAPARKMHSRRATVVLELGRQDLVFEDARRFGRMTFETAALERLEPEPLEGEFTVEGLRQALASSRQPIKVRLLDQSVVAGVGNIYASEALFLARIHPCTPSRNLSQVLLRDLRTALRRVLSEAIRFGSTVPLDFTGLKSSDDLFYYGQSAEKSGRYEERLRVYDREGDPCRRCGTPVRKIRLAGRSTYFCPGCQR